LKSQATDHRRSVPGSNQPKWRKKLEQFRSHLLAYDCHAKSLASSNPGVRQPKGEPEIIASLTSTHARLDRVHLTIETLLRQAFQPHRIILWLADDLAGEKLPRPLQRQQSRGLEISFRRELRSFTKLIHTLREHPSAIIVTADDDVFYPRQWLEQLHESHRLNPAFIHCHRAHLMRETASGAVAPYLDWNLLARSCTGPSLWLFPTGVGGVLYPPGVLHREIFNEELFLKLCPTADDVWFKAMSLLTNVPVVKASAATGNYPTVPGTQRESLHSHNWEGRNYDQQIQAVFEHYDLLPLSKNRPCFNEVCPLFNCGLLHEQHAGRRADI
jgi:hypothetical protein